MNEKTMDQMTPTTPDNEPAAAQDDSEPQSPEGRLSEQRSQPGFFQRLSYAFRPQSYDDIRQNLQQALDNEIEGDHAISAHERAMLSNILRLREVRVADVMIPRAEIEAVDLTISLGALMQLFVASGHSRMPVYDETLDDPRGMVHIRDIVGYLTTQATKKRRGRRSAKSGQASRLNGNGSSPMESAVADNQIDLSKIDLTKTIGELKLTRDVLFVPPSMLASDLMARMQASRIQMALVIDEYGGTDGLVSLEDIVEMVVGDIEDEHDDYEERIVKQPDGSFVVDARVELIDVSEHLGSGFLAAAQSEDDEVDTIGGLIVSLLGRVPVRGELVPAFAGYEIQILEADPRRVRRARLVPQKAAARRRPVRKDPHSIADRIAQESATPEQDVG